MEFHIAPPQSSCGNCGWRGTARLAPRRRNLVVTIGLPLAVALAWPLAAVVAVLLFFGLLTWTLLETRPVCPRCGNRV